jgi:hypothetical protein
MPEAPPTTNPTLSLNRGIVSMRASHGATTPIQCGLVDSPERATRALPAAQAVAVVRVNLVTNDCANSTCSHAGGRERKCPHSAQRGAESPRLLGGQDRSESSNIGTAAAGNGGCDEGSEIVSDLTQVIERRIDHSSRRPHGHQHASRRGDAIIRTPRNQMPNQRFEK